MQSKNIQPVALIVIGRNEAENLKISLPAVHGLFKKIIYVDSGSSDESREIAARHDVEVIKLDSKLPFTAARARNAGFEALQVYQDIKYVQFIDGDCELIPEYLFKALVWLEAHPAFAMVCGRRVERYPERTIFNKLCNLEWNTPIGETKYCGGDVTVRIDAIKQVEGYNSGLIAGEDPELCVRLRKAGWKIYRLDADMTRHDANITQLSQWWKRHQRTGHAYAEGALLHGSPPEYHCVRETKRNWFWGGFFFFILLGALLFSPWLLLFLLLFPLQAARIALKVPTTIRALGWSTRFIYGFDCAFSKVPEFIGQLLFVYSRITKKKQSLIEYK